MVIKKLGEKVWTLLLEKANITHDFIETQNYPDEHIYTILEAGAKVPMAPSGLKGCGLMAV